MSNAFTRLAINLDNIYFWVKLTCFTNRFFHIKRLKTSLAEFSFGVEFALDDVVLTVDLWEPLFGFNKNERSTLSAKEAKALHLLAEHLLSLSEDKRASAAEAGALQEVTP